MSGIYLKIPIRRAERIEKGRLARQPIHHHLNGTHLTATKTNFDWQF